GLLRAGPQPAGDLCAGRGRRARMTASIDLAIIGGTGLYQLAALESPEAMMLDTRYGVPSGPLRVGMLAGRRVAFLARHGEAHSVAPHRINYRANIRALADAGAKR